MELAAMNGAGAAQVTADSGLALWNKLFSATGAYGITSVAAEQMWQLAAEMRMGGRKGQALYNKYASL